MKAFIATYEDKNHNPSAEQITPTLMIAARSLKHAATKAHEEQNSSGRGDLIRVELTDKVII